MKKKLKAVLQFILNPKLLLCLLIAWFITNGWSYLLLGIGSYYDIGWMKAVSAAYIAFLWLPVSPEKIVTVAVAIALLRICFPKDEKTLAVLKELYEKVKNTLKSKNERSKNKRAERKKEKPDKNPKGE